MPSARISASVFTLLLRFHAVRLKHYREVLQFLPMNDQTCRRQLDETRDLERGFDPL